MNDNAIDVKSRNGKNSPCEWIKNARGICPNERDALDISQPWRAQHVRVSHSRLETNIPKKQKKKKTKKKTINFGFNN